MLYFGMCKVWKRLYNICVVVRMEILKTGTNTVFVLKKRRTCAGLDTVFGQCVSLRR